MILTANKTRTIYTVKKGNCLKDRLMPKLKKLIHHI